jgi:hypothetical protein
MWLKSALSVKLVSANGQEATGYQVRESFDLS